MTIVIDLSLIWKRRGASSLCQSLAFSKRLMTLHIKYPNFLGLKMPRIRAAVLHGINDLRVQPWDLPDDIAQGNVRIAIKRVGICQSDVHYWSVEICNA